ncbi:LuxR C-terminal-related transcriptional regulator [Streptomyces sp. NPDC048172]|uniref:helix-turn-helix transcriptional regulator n=1 Tax=Streptomyces sp. NPDC048172 TaxID=3365505 RepID=UPI003720A8FE
MGDPPVPASRDHDAGDGATGARAAVPPLPGWLVPRPRLVSRLVQGVRGPLTVVVGPAGAGKTALVTEWAHTARPPGPVVWVACDGENEPREVFWPRMLARLREAGIEVTDEDLAPAPPSDHDRLSAVRLTDALTRRTAPVVVVLEDFQPDPGSFTAHDITLLLRHAYPSIRLVVISRRDPPLHLHRQRLAGALTELRTADLAFTEKETAALLAQHGVTLTGSWVRRLAQRTEGWAAGVRLAAMSMAGHPDPARFVAQFAGDEEAVVSYLAEEVLDVQPPPMRHLLLVTSILDRMNRELTAAVAGEEAAGQFAALVQQNTFLHPVGHGWYRCHPMFRDVLRLRLRHEASGQLAGLHLRAAVWLGAHGPLVEALEHTLAAHDPARAARLVVERLAVGGVLGLSADRLPDALAHRLLRALARIPAEVREPATALVTAALALAHEDAEGCAEALREASREGAWEGTWEASPNASGEAGEPAAAPDGDAFALAARLTRAVIRTEAARSADPVAARTAAGELVELCARLPRAALERHPELSALTLYVHGDAELRHGRLKDAERALLAAASAAASAAEGSPLHRDCLIGLALLEAVRGRLRSAADLADRARRTPARAPGATDRSCAALHVVAAWTALGRGQLSAARHELAFAERALQVLPDAPVGALRLLAGEVARLCARRVLPASAAIRGLCAAMAGPWPTEGLERAVHLVCAVAQDLGRTPGSVALPGPGTPLPGDEVQELGATVAGTLSGRERDVLEFLARTMTTEEIAAEMYLSVNTVKTHLKNIYRKLQVSRRSAAVRRARELELL